MSIFPRIGHPDADAWAAECEAAYEAEWGGRDGEVLVVSGSRRHPNLKMVERYLRWYLPQLPRNTVIRTGGAEGVDQLAERIAQEIGLPTETLRPFYPAYPRDPKRAPLERNTVMVNGGVLRDKLWRSSNKVLAFPGNLEGEGGIWDTIRKGRAAGKPTAVVGMEKRLLHAPDSGMQSRIKEKCYETRPLHRTERRPTGYQPRVCDLRPKAIDL